VFARYPSGHLGLVGDGGAMELYNGRLRAINPTGKLVLPDVKSDDYIHYFNEGVEPWSYMKFPYLKHLGRAKGWNRVGPLARVNVCDRIPTPLAEEERKYFFEFSGSKPNNSTMYYHWARLIELLHCAEVVKELLEDKDILGKDLRVDGKRRGEGIGVIEAPRGTLIHHYQVDERGMITRCNLIVSTTHNNEPMNRAVRWVAQNVLDSQNQITEGMLNQVEVVVRAFDPCLSCATHALGQMPLQVSVYDHNGLLVDEKFKS
jgi:NAD-reducing hydrogenase large subunit